MRGEREREREENGKVFDSSLITQQEIKIQLSIYHDHFILGGSVRSNVVAGVKRRQKGRGGGDSGGFNQG